MRNPSRGLRNPSCGVDGFRKSSTHPTRSARSSWRRASVRPTKVRRPSMNKPVAPSGAIRGEEHWTQKGDVRLFLFEKYASDPSGPAGTILFVHGSSMASQPTFDLHVPGRPDSSVMEWFAARGFDCWCVDMEGYGRSTKDRNNNAPIALGAEDCFAAARAIQKLRGKRPLLVYGISSGA